jgi:hypothetical protein
MRVPIDGDPRRRAWQRQLEHVGLSHTSLPVPRSPAGFGIGAAKSGHEVDPPVRPRPPVAHMRNP